MAADNPWFLITLNEVEEIQKQLISLEKELPGISRHQIRQVTGILHDVRERWA